MLGGRGVNLGNTSVDFSFRGSRTKQRALFANEITGSDESTIIFADGPGEAEKVAEELLAVNKEFFISEDVKDFISFIKTEVHEDYPLAVSLASGVAFHSMSSTLEIIHKYHIISAQISAWEKPF